MSFPTFTLLFVQKYSCLYNKKKIVWWLKNNIVVKKLFYSLATIVHKILFLPLENKIQIFTPPCYMLSLYLYIEIKYDENA